MTKGQFVEKFRYQLELVKGEPEIMSTYENYYRQASELRSEAVRELRELGCPGGMRSAYNNHLQRYMPNHRDYLYARDPYCALCGCLITHAMERTIDHIIPVSRGGENHTSNYQLAHPKCNVLKGNRFETEQLRLENPVISSKDLRFARA